MGSDQANPRLIDKDHRKLMAGESRIDTGVGAICSTIPFPGATCTITVADHDAGIVGRCAIRRR